MQQQDLKAEIVRKGFTQKDVAKQMGMSDKTFYRKMKNGIWGTDEASQLIEILNLENPARIFFAKKVT